MCGIGGIFSHDIGSIRSIEVMSSLIRHRGPDDEGYLLIGNQKEVQRTFGTETNIETKQWLIEQGAKPLHQTLGEHTIGALLHRRLSILDLSVNGHQPMAYASSGCWITFNGEIYNYPEIRSELEKLGDRFQTRTDTEVILAAYSRWGADCVSKFNGMWAFAIYDPEKNSLFLSRDRSGVKPLYYSKVNGFVFASEIKAICMLPWFSSSLNEQSALLFLRHGISEALEETMIQQIQELKPGHHLTYQIAHRTLSVARYYDHRNIREQGINESEAIEKTKSLLEQAISMRLRSDVETGSCLSGGIDSSIIAYVMAKQQPTEKKLKFFTSCFEDKAFDERNWAELVINDTGMEWYKVFPNIRELSGDFEDLVYTQDLPFISLSTYSQYCVMRKVKQTGVKVVLDGQGADELFGGYPHYLAIAWVEQVRRGNIRVTGELYGGLQAMGYSGSQVVKYLIKYGLPSTAAKVLHHWHTENRYLIGDSRVPPIPAETLDAQLRHDYFEGPLKNLLKCEDRSSMAFSVESRTPFADDHQLAEHIFSTPTEWKYKGGQTKAMLRASMRGVVRDEILNRKDKKGYLSLNNQWIEQLGDQFRSYFESENSGLIDKKLLLKDYPIFTKISGKPENYRVFRLISFAAWHVRYIQHPSV